MSNRAQDIAKILAGQQLPTDSTAPYAMDSQGLQMPPEITQALVSMLTPSLIAGLAKASARAPAGLRALGEAGSIFPEATPENLPAVAAGSKTGAPHALFAYNDDFGPNMTKRSIYNVFGDPTHPAIQKAGWGSSVPIDVLKKFGIPVTGKQAGKAF